jgi:hypothetical protein
MLAATQVQVIAVFGCTVDKRLSNLDTGQHAEVCSIAECDICTRLSEMLPCTMRRHQPDAGSSADSSHPLNTVKPPCSCPHSLDNMGPITLQTVLTDHGY